MVSTTFPPTDLFLPFSFLSQSVHLLEEDESLYCISAWNDQVSQCVCVLSSSLLCILLKQAASCPSSHSYSVFSTTPLSHQAWERGALGIQLSETPNQHSQWSRWVGDSEICSPERITSELCTLIPS